MGTSFSRRFNRWITRNERRILFIGLDGAGKTTVLYRLRLGKTINSIPTIGFNVEVIEFHKLKLNIWDVGGQDTLRPYWRHHFTGTQGIVFILDSADMKRIHLAKTELYNVLNDAQLKDACLLVLLNKRDLPNVISKENIINILDITTICNDTNRKYMIQETVATKGNGINDGMHWLCENMKEL